ncbi:glutathione peroxidase [Acidobacteria bacterium AB60]|nr:glutathione peroxidase [Acidobacteria bacterium AB60]
MPYDGGSLYEISAELLDGAPVSLSRFEGKVLLIVNTASRCGFTPQYAALEQLYRKFQGQGFEVLGFPCNQFGAQEPGSAQDIGEFCERNYGVSFPMFAKVDVNGPATHPLFRLLKAARPGLLGSQRIKWNFTKFLVDRRGDVVSRHAPRVSPSRLQPEVEALLARR